MLRNSPEQSYKRLNPALRDTLRNCIEADLPFQRSTFKTIFAELRGSWWFGDGAGSSAGEHFYSLACSCHHDSAQQSFEDFAERPGVLWEQDTKAAERLHVGSQFTWRGQYLTVTSMRKDSLVGCTYKDYKPRVEGLKPGATFGYDPEYVITQSKRAGAATLLTVIPSKPDQGEREVARRVIVTYAEISAFRKQSKADLKAMLAKIAQCNPEKDSAKLTKEINAANFLHWQLEGIQAAFQARKEWISNEGKIEAWRQGENGAWVDFKGIALRVKGDLVECTNGNSVSKVAAARALPVLIANRNKSASLCLPLDGYTVDRVGPSGVKIGCTSVPWSEIDRIAPELAKEPKEVEA